VTSTSRHGERERERFVTGACRPCRLTYALIKCPMDVAAKRLRAHVSNFTLKIISVPVEKGCRLLIVFVAAPALGAAGFGIYQFASAIAGLLSICTDLGLSIWTTRALARKVAPGSVVLGTGMALKSAAILPTVAILLLAALAQAPGVARQTLILLGVTALVSTFIDYFGSIFRGYERLRDEAWLNGARAFLITGAGLAGLRISPSVTGLAGGVLVGTLASAAVGLWILRRRYGLVATFGRNMFDRKLARVAIREVMPLWLAGALSVLYFRCDTVLVGTLAGDAALGAYSAAYKIFEASLIFPITIMAVAFTPLARAYGVRSRQLRTEVLLVALLAGGGVIFGVSIYCLRDQIIARIFGIGFGKAAASLRILSMAIAVAFVNRGLTNFIIARGLELRYLVLAGLLLAVNIGANLAMIPHLGGVGAAWATLITETVLAIGSLVALNWRTSISSIPTSPLSG
jgi:O-antigen/teichoic acid export membrane protein